MLIRNCSPQPSWRQEKSLAFLMSHVAVSKPFISPKACKTTVPLKRCHLVMPPIFLCSPLWSCLQRPPFLEDIAPQLQHSFHPSTTHHSWEPQQPYGLVTKISGLPVPWFHFHTLLFHLSHPQLLFPLRTPSCQWMYRHQLSSSSSHTLEHPLLNASPSWDLHPRLHYFWITLPFFRWSLWE